MPRTYSRPVTIRGVTYDSGIEAAKAIGVHPGVISQARKMGWLDGVGLGVKRPITIDGVEYESGRAAARALGISEYAVSKMRRKWKRLGIQSAPANV